MSDGALRISILGDASQFTKTLDQLEKDLKGFQDKLKSATGVEIPKLNLQILGAETSIKQITEFGKFAQGSLGFYQQLKKELEGQLLVTTNRAEQEQLNKRLSETVSIIKEIKSAGLSKPVEIKVVPPSDDSIKGIQEKIKRITAIRDIQAEPENIKIYNAYLDQLEKRLKSLKTIGINIPVTPIEPYYENTISGIKKQIDDLNKRRINVDVSNEDDLIRLGKEIAELEARLKNLQNLGRSVPDATNGLSSGFKKIQESGKNARIAVTNLSLVAQDLPFGFIAIQNNLPAVIQSFGQLKTQSGSTKGALSALASGLVGPAGLFLAFSVVTGAVTFAIQKYGSLGAALDRLSGSYFELGDVTNNAVKSLQEYNKNLKTTSEITSKGEASEAGRVIQVRALSSAVLDLTKSDFERKKALDALKKLDEQRFKNFDIEKDNLDKLRKATEDYTRAIISEAVAAKFRDQVSQTSLELENQRLRLKDLVRQLDEVEKKYPNVAKKAKDYLDLISTPIAGQEGAVSEGKGVREFLKISEAIKVAEGDIVTVRTQLENFNTAAFNATQTASTLASAIEGTGDKAAPAAKKIKGLKEELQKVVPLFDLLKVTSPKLKEELYFDFLKDFFSENDLKELQYRFKKRQEILKKLEEYRGKTPKLPDVTPTVTLSPLSRQMAITREEMIKDFEDTKVILEEVFFTPLSDLFTNFFDTGKFAFEEFGKSILNTIKSLVSKIIATGIINLLANILFPGGGIASANFGGAATGAGGGILGAFKAAFNSILGIGKIANPNFGGVQGGGMQLAGEVVFRQRGSDLIGVINRTNGTINRVG